MLLEATGAARAWLGENGYDAEFGARPLRRLIQTEIEDLLSDAVLSGRFTDGETVLVDVEEGKIVLKHGGETDEEPVEEALPAV